MLGKLIKYDLKAMGKIMVPFWIALFAVGIVWGAQMRLRDIVSIHFLGGGTGFVIILLIFTALVMAVFAMNVIVVVQRFWKGILKEEGYLMFTLPVTPRALIFSKVLSSFLISLATIIILTVLVSLIIAMQGVDLYGLQVALQNLKIDEVFVKWSVYGVIFGIFALLNSIYHIYAAMAIGQLSNRNRMLCAFAAYVILAVVFGVIEIPLMDFTKEWGALVITIVEVMIYHIITEYILSKKLNLE